jgi:octaheme c-type cytochrome (tetrathionate reductase family)
LRPDTETSGVQGNGFQDAIPSHYEENKMKAKILAACAVALMVLPLSAAAATGGDATALAKAPTLAKAGSDALSPEAYIEYASVNDVNIHELFFSSVLYEGTESCLLCHQETAEAMLGMGHFKWQGKVENIVGMEGRELGKNQLLNNFCIAVPTNEPRCTQCHAGYGYADKNFNFNDPANIDCLVCHDQSGTYAKHPKMAGLPDPGVDLNAVARSIAEGATPTRKACIGCHAKAGGGDNVKHGDLSTDLIATTREYDVHMGVDGANLVCADCHGANHDPQTGAVNHGNAGMSLHSVHEGEMKQCTDCHGSALAIHRDTAANELIEPGWHDRLACQVCHIPAIARAKPTKLEWYWETAGDADRVPVMDENGMPDYDKMKGDFVWGKNVRPVLRYSNGKWERKVIGLNDTYDEEPIQFTIPQGGYSDPNAMIYPFKLMKGNQPVDPVNKTIMVPHLFPSSAGPNAYWKSYDWNLALQDGANYTGQPYSGTVGFASSEMLLSVNHEIAPKEMALGSGAMPESCMDCHVSGAVDFTELGWTADPFNGGQRVDDSASAQAAEPGANRLD